MELFETGLLDLGPQVAIIDDKEEEAKPIEKAFDDLNVGNQLFIVDFTDPQYPEHPLNNLELVFLDLHYNEAFGADFDPYLCCNWLNKIVPPDKKYVLVIWSRDPEKAEQLLEAMKEVKVTIPFLTEIKPKQEYQNGIGQYDIDRLLMELRDKSKEYESSTEDFLGKVLEVYEDTVLINCLINEDPKVFEVREFDLQPFKDFVTLTPGSFLNIKITTKPRERSIDFYPLSEDMSEKFVKPESERHYGDLSWLDEKE
jgi:hypothetical protein